MAEFCFELAHDDKLNAAPGINIVGTSQGGIIARAYLEQCNNPPVLNFISWVSPQGGQFGVPGLGNATWGAIIEVRSDVFSRCYHRKGTILTPFPTLESSRVLHL